MTCVTQIGKHPFLSLATLIACIGSSPGKAEIPPASPSLSPSATFPVLVTELDERPVRIEESVSFFAKEDTALPKESLEAEPLRASVCDRTPSSSHPCSLPSAHHLAQLPPLPEPDEEPVIPSIEPEPPTIFEPSPSTPSEPPTPRPLPPPAELLPPSPTTPPSDIPSEGIPQAITVKQFEFVGNTAFSDERLAEITEPYTDRPITFAELLNARTEITQLYLDAGYVTSGAFIPPQTLTEGTVTIQILEGGLEGIEVSGTERLNPGYVRSRLAIATEKPLNVPELIEALRLLQLDPLLENISAELSTGSGPGTSLLSVEVAEANPWSAEIFANNGRSPSVGSFRRGASLTHANVFGIGDGFTVGYTNTDGSNEIDLSYTLPLNPRDGTLTLSYGNTSSDVIEEPFTPLDIESSSRYFDLTVRQPVFRTPTQEFAIGITGSRRESDTSFDPFGTGRIPFPRLEADEDGRIVVSALRFFQEWTKQGPQEVLALRSQFSIGLDAFNSTINDAVADTGEEIPDSRFFAWRGQAQWVRLLAPDTLLLIRGDVQLADQGLLPIEQFGLGGLGSVRGYRQDQLLTDSGVFASAEVRLPIVRIPEWEGILQLIPFVDVGTAWNVGDAEDPDPNTLASVGLGLQWQQGDWLTARLEWGIPLISVDSNDNTLQEEGIYFSITISPF
jgi:hemolysin activation/secretion protein